MSYLNRYLFQTRQEQEQQQSQQQQQSQANEKEQEQEQKEIIYSTATVWISGGNRPTLYIPIGLAKKYRMDIRCRVAFFDKDKDNGILIRFLHDNNKNND